MYRFLRYFILELIIISLFFGDFVVSEDKKIEETNIRKKRQSFRGYGHFLGLSVPFFNMVWGQFGAESHPPPFFHPPYIPHHMWGYGYGHGYGYGPMFFG
uniref:Uncharacterized protein n=1 Tax=Onchocerca volvulus TaxID=6282 RepID=A0A2K6VS32_ONCVO